MADPLPMQQAIQSEPHAAPIIRQGAADQAAAYEALLAGWADVDPDADERDWRRVRERLQDARRTSGQRLLFAE